MMRRGSPSLCSCCRNAAPLLALRKAAVAMPANCSAPCCSARFLNSCKTSCNSCRVRSLNFLPGPAARSSQSDTATRSENIVLVIFATDPTCRSTSATTILQAAEPTSKAARRTIRLPPRSSAARPAAQPVRTCSRCCSFNARLLSSSCSCERAEICHDAADARLATGNQAASKASVATAPSREARMLHCPTLKADSSGCRVLGWRWLLGGHVEKLLEVLVLDAEPRGWPTQHIF
mmetsp:Transcript_48851/g.71622  ORF Transcript_48851/g.71622 Transcript_48851/m.71622 type:complete len:235 (-) Transcript_48851:29-733(-)